MQMPKSANVVPARSAAVFRRTAERRPSGNATTSEIAIASSASCRLGRMRRPTFSITGSPLRIELVVQDPLVVHGSVGDDAIDGEEIADLRQDRGGILLELREIEQQDILAIEMLHEFVELHCVAGCAYAMLQVDVPVAMQRVCDL